MIDVDVVEAAGRADLRLRGELDMAGVLRVEPYADRLLARGDLKALTLDLREVVFMDSTGLGMLTTLLGRTRAEGVEYRIIRGPKDVQRIFEISGAPLPLVDAPGESR